MIKKRERRRIQINILKETADRLEHIREQHELETITDAITFCIKETYKKYEEESR